MESFRVVWLVTLFAIVATASSAAPIPVGGACTLADAIRAANTDLAVNGCPAGSGPDLLTLSEDVMLTTVEDSAGFPNFDSGLPQVTSEITIEGGGFVIQRDLAAPRFRIFWVSDFGVLVLRNLSILNGDAAQDSWGGGILVAGIIGPPPHVPSLQLDHVILANNRAALGGAISSEVESGVVISHSTISGNTAVQCGGGTSSGSGPVTLFRSMISGNTSEQFGGGICAAFSQLLIEDSTISDNEALNSGGGINVIESRITMRNVTVSGNRASGVGGGLSLSSGPTPSHFDFEHVSILGNMGSQGSGVSFFDYDVGGDLTVIGSIIAGNTGGGSECQVDKPITDGGSNFAADASCGAGFAPILPGIDISISLADNGGPTLTHELLTGSPAIDAVGDCGLPADQRGAVRADGACDSGAFEFEAMLFATMESMTATSTAEGVIVQWTTATEIDTVGFRVLRDVTRSRELKTEKSGDARPISDWIPAAGTSLQGTDYAWVDRLRKDPRTVFYYIEEVDLFGRITRHGPIIPTAPVVHDGGARTRTQRSRWR